MNVTVVIACRNEERHVSRAIESVVTQTVNHCIDEIIVVDDKSADGTVPLLRAIGEKNPKLVILAGTGGGPAAARNMALRRAKGDVIALLDADDYWAPDKLARQLPAFEKGERIGLVYGDYIDFSSDDASDAMLIKVRRLRTTSQNLLAEYFVNDGPIIPSTAIIRRAVFEDVGLFDEDLLVGEDTDMCMRIAERWQLQHVDGGLTFKRRHAGNLTRRLDRLIPVGELLTRRFVDRNPNLMPLAGRRMARRYARAGNDCIAKGEVGRGLRYLARAMRYAPFYWRSYMYLCFAVVPPFMATAVRRAAKRFFYNHIV
jgi:glycosyltransferase involved in cell wall biosynthesis